jgi:hypothetical protein
MRVHRETGIILRCALCENAVFAALRHAQFHFDLMTGGVYMVLVGCRAAGRAGFE